jgi:hypothetical protein
MRVNLWNIEGVVFTGSWETSIKGARWTALVALDLLKDIVKGIADVE